MKDVAVLLDIMKGPDHYDNLTFQAIGHYPEKGYAAEVTDASALRGMKLGLPWDAYWSSNGVSSSITYVIFFPCNYLMLMFT